ncbi:MAG: hypothetical protein QXI58_06150 [Candidatus Micrarchaeia archaeon]
MKYILKFKNPTQYLTQRLTIETDTIDDVLLIVHRVIAQPNPKIRIIWDKIGERFRLTKVFDVNQKKTYKVNAKVVKTSTELIQETKKVLQKLKGMVK